MSEVPSEVLLPVVTSDKKSEDLSEVGLKYKKENLSVHARGLPIVNVWSWLGFPHVPAINASTLSWK
jgi:hypothetical protein